MSSKSGLATLEYAHNGFRQLTPGDHVACAVTGVPVALDMLRYWSVDRQEAYASAQIATDRLTGKA